jgi:hypothetical protein
MHVAVLRDVADLSLQLPTPVPVLLVHAIRTSNQNNWYRVAVFLINRLTKYLNQRRKSSRPARKAPVLRFDNTSRRCG